MCRLTHTYRLSLRGLREVSELRKGTVDRDNRLSADDEEWDEAHYYSTSWPGCRGTRWLGENGASSEGPRGCRTTTSFGPSSTDTVRSREISLSGRACWQLLPSLKQLNTNIIKYKVLKRFYFNSITIISKTIKYKQLLTKL